MIEPYQGRVYDPVMGSGGFFVQSERFIEEHGGTIGDIMVFGQDQWAWGAHLRRAQRARRVRLRRKQPNQSNPTTWRLAAMNMAIRGIDFDFGKEPADTFTRDQHPDLRADFVMALPSAAACSHLRSHSADRPEGKGSGVDKVIEAVEADQLPAPDFRAGARRTSVILFAHRDFEEMDRPDRIQATYQHCCLRYVMNEKVTNQSLRERFSLPREKWQRFPRSLPPRSKPGRSRSQTRLKPPLATGITCPSGRDFFFKCKFLEPASQVVKY